MKNKKSTKWMLCLAVTVLVFGTVLILVWPQIFRTILKSKFVLTPDSDMYGPWKKNPLDIPVEFYLFNWTNPEEIYGGVKPKLQEVGPYKYTEGYEKKDVTFNRNGTVTFRNARFWHYKEGNIEEIVTMINPIMVTAVHALRSSNFFVRHGFSVAISGMFANISITDSAANLLFAGHRDPIIELGKGMAFLTGKLPYDQFGFFYGRNNSLDVDGVLNMGTGVNSVLGKLYNWNYDNRTSAYDGECGVINSSAGDFFEGGKDTISFFVPDMCRPFTLKYSGKKEVKGILGDKYVLDSTTLDNGSVVEENKCFCSGECMPSGVLNISKCNYGSPFFVSLPHFYRADPYYTSLVEGLNPDPDKHEFFMVLEPTTGITLQADTKTQGNILLEPNPSVILLKNVPKLYFPLMWNRHVVEIPDEEVFKLKLLLALPVILTSCGIVMSSLGLLILVYNMYKNCKKSDKEDDALCEQSIPFEIRN